jgi:hypothetical protein
VRIYGCVEREQVDRMSERDASLIPLGMHYSLRRKIIAPFDFYGSHVTIRLIQKNCENAKTIMIYLKYIR